MAIEPHVEDREKVQTHLGVILLQPSVPGDVRLH